MDFVIINLYAYLSLKGKAYTLTTSIDECIEYINYGKSN